MTPACLCPHQWLADTCSQSRLAIMQARLQDVNNLVKIKNPSLLLQVGRGGGGRYFTCFHTLFAVPQLQKPSRGASPGDMNASMASRVSHHY